MIKKIEAGCSYFLTQPVYDEEGIKRLAFLKERTGAKILIGIMPLVSRRNALFIKNEMPGIYVPDRVVEKYKEKNNKKFVHTKNLSTEKKRQRKSLKWEKR